MDLIEEGFVLVIFTLVWLLVAVAGYVWYAWALSRLFKRLGTDGWRGWVPILNEMTIFERGGVASWQALFLYFPIINLYGFYLKFTAAQRIGQHFGRGTGMAVLAVLFSPVWATMLVLQKSPAPGAPQNQAPQAAGHRHVAGGMASGQPAPAAPGAPRPGQPAPGAPGGAPRPGQTQQSPFAPTANSAPHASPAGRPAPPAPQPGQPAPPAPGAPQFDQSAPPAPPAPGGLGGPQAGQPSPGAPGAPPAPRPGQSAPPAPGVPPFGQSAPPAPPAPSAPGGPSTPQPGQSAPSTPMPEPAQPDAPVSGPAADSGPIVVHNPWAKPVAPAPVSPASSDAPDWLKDPASASAAGADPAPDLLNDEDDGETIVVDRRPKVQWHLNVDNAKPLPLVGDKVLLGRRPSATEPGTHALAVPDTTRTLSKAHARLELVDGEWSITDLDSTNGVLIVDEAGEEALITPGESVPVPGRFILGKVGMHISFEQAGA